MRVITAADLYSIKIFCIKIVSVTSEIAPNKRSSNSYCNLKVPVYII